MRCVNHGTFQRDGMRNVHCGGRLTCWRMKSVHLFAYVAPSTNEISMRTGLALVQNCGFLHWIFALAQLATDCICAVCQMIFFFKFFSLMSLVLGWKHHLYASSMNIVVFLYISKDSIILFVCKSVQLFMGQYGRFINISIEYYSLHAWETKILNYRKCLAVTI